MIINGMFIYFSFILIIILTIILKEKPILIGALGLFAIGITEAKGFFSGIQIAFRSLLHTADDLLPIILLIGLVVSLSTMLNETGTDRVLIRPLLKLKNISIIYWLLGLILLFLTLFLWPTPAVTLLGVLILPLINNSKINPLGLAVGLCIFGEGIGLAGDFVIQGAPGLVARSAGLEIEDVVMSSIPLVLGSGFFASVVGYSQLILLNRKDTIVLTDSPSVLNDPSPGNNIVLYNGVKHKIETRSDNKEVRTQGNSQEVRNQSANQEIPSQKDITHNKKIILAGTFILLFAASIAYLLLSGLRGDSAAAVTGGITILIIVFGALLTDYKSSLNTFVQYIQSGMKLSMSVFAPIIVIAAFFSLGTRGGSENIFLRSGPGYLEQLAVLLSNYLTLNIYTCSLIVIFAAILGAMSGSGFSALPLVGGIAAALGQAAALPVVPLAVLGQAVAIWTDAMVIPWGFPAVVSAITKTDAVKLMRLGIFPWVTALIFLYLFTVLSI